MKQLLSGPTTVNLELTELCNVKCRHCYNFWRDESMGSATLDVDRLDRVIDRMIEAEVFHVILTGGEPFSKFDLLTHALERLRDTDITTSCNSNLMLVSDEKIKALRDLGLDHILTSLPSIDPALNDYIMSAVGSYEKIISGIRCTVDNGIRVSVNMVITRQNFEQVYEMGRLVSELGCQKLFVTRSVPPTYSEENDDSEYALTPEEQKFALDEALRVKEDFGIMIGTLVSYPLCFLSDLQKYADFVGRGCPAQAGHRMSLNADGTVHACVHEEESYGNVFDQPIREVYQGTMRKWHDSSFHYEGCAGCTYSDVCESGCSMTAIARYGAHEAKDPLFVGPHNFSTHFEVADQSLLEDVKNGLAFKAPARLRFRDEGGFYLLNIRWGNSITIETRVAEFLMRHRDSGELFTLEEFGVDDAGTLANLFAKDAVEAPAWTGFKGDKEKQGMSIDFARLKTASL